MKYFIIEDNTQQGPFSIYELKDKQIGSETLVWAEGLADWTPAWKVEELRGFLFGQTDTATPPPYTPDTAKTADSTHQELPLTTDNEPQKKKKSGGCLGGFGAVLLGALATLLIAMAVACPDKRAHCDAVKQSIMQGIAKSAANHDDIFGAGLGMLKNIMGLQAIDKLADEMVDYHNYVFFSKGTVQLDGKSHTISYGLLGRVFTINEDDVAEYIEQNNPVAAIEDFADEIPMGRVVKKKLKEFADSTATNVLEQVLGGISDLIKNELGNAE